MSWIATGVAAASAIYQVGSGIHQKNQANKLKQSDFNYVPQGLTMNRDLALEQAYSRRAPGAAFAESQNRRLAANQIAAAQRMFGGDANKIAAVSAGATANAEDANTKIAQQGQQFSENAFNRLRSANSDLARNDRQNYNDYWDTVAKLKNAGNTNIYNGLNNAGSAAITGMSIKNGGGGFTGGYPGGYGGQSNYRNPYWPQMNWQWGNNYNGYGPN